MLRVGEAPSGAGEKKERRERTDEQKRRYARKILEVSIKYGLTEEDEKVLFEMLDMTYGGGSSSGETGSESGSTHESEPRRGEEGASETESEEEATEEETEEGAPEAEEEAAEGEEEAAEGEEEAAEGEEEESDAAAEDEESGEDLKDYEPVTLEMAMNGNSKIDDISGIIPTIEARHPDIAKIAISFAIQWNTMTDQQRIDILKNDISIGLSGMADTLEAAGLIKVSRDSSEAAPVSDGEEGSEGEEGSGEEGSSEGGEEGSDEEGSGEEGSGEEGSSEGGEEGSGEEGSSEGGEEGSSEEGSSEGGEEGSGEEGSGEEGSEGEEGSGEEGSEDEEGSDEEGEDEESEEDGERRERANEFISDEDKAFWFETVKGKDPFDIANNPDEYPIDAIDELENEYENDRRQFAEDLAGLEGFGDWYESTGGSVPDLGGMGYKKLYELKQQFEQRKAAMDQPLVAVSAASDQEIERRARQIAEADIEERVKKAKGLRGLLTKLWSGNYGKEFEIRMRQKVVFDRLKEKNDLLLRKEKGEDIDEARLAELESLVGKDTWIGNSGDTERFVMAHVENMREMLRKDKGEEMRVYGVEYVETDENELNEDGTPKLDEDGNPIKKRVPKAFRMDKKPDGSEIKVAAEGKEAEQAIRIEQSIRAYASVIGNIERDSSLSADQKREQQEGALDQFRREMAALRLEDLQNGGDGSMINNYEIVATRAAERAKHEASIDNVMNGFRYIDGEMNRDVSTEAHRNAVEKLVNRINQVPFVPEAAAVATASIIMAVTKSSGNSLARAAGGLVGGAAVGAILEGIKYGDRLKSQYATAAREIAMGGRLEGGKLEAEMQENIMTFMTREKEGGGREVITAGLLTSELGAATDELNAAYAAFAENPDNDELRNNLKAAAAVVGEKLTDARMRLMVGDQQSVDLMGFSSSNLSTIESERMDLWKGIAEAQVAFNHAQEDDRIADGEFIDIAQAKDQAEAQLLGVIKTGRKEMGSDIRARAIRHASGAFIRNIFIGGLIDDGLANINPNKISTLENLGIVKSQNNVDATNSFFSGFLDKIGVPGFKSETVIQGMTFDNMAKAQEYAQKNGLSNITKQHNPNKDVTSTVRESDSSYAQRWGKINPRRWGNNQTEGIYEGNEARLYGDPDSLYTNMRGTSTDWAGNSMNAEAIQKAGKMRLLISFSKDTQMHPVSLPIKPDGHVDYSSLTAGEFARVKAGDIWCAEVADTSGSTTDVFATILYGKGGGEIETTTVTEGFDYVVEGLRSVVDRGVSFGATSLAGSLNGGRGIGIRRNRGEGTTEGGGTP